MAKKTGLILLVMAIFGSSLAACTASPAAVQTVAPAASEVAAQVGTTVATQMAGPVGTQVAGAVTQASTQIAVIGTTVAGAATQNSTQIAELAVTLQAAAVNGELLTNTVCTACHPMDTVGQLKNDEAGWRAFLSAHHDMDKLPVEQLDAIVKFLAEKYPR